MERRVLAFLPFLVLLAAVGTAAVLSFGPRAGASSVPASATAPGVAGVTMGTGGETWFMNLSSSEQASWISTMVADGVKWLRIDSPGDLAGWYNTEIADAEAAGINVDVVIETWGMSSVSASTMGPMCTSQVKQMEPLGVETYEVINEPNVNGYSAADYEPLLAACDSAIKAADSGAEVLMGGLADAGGSEAAATYLAAVYAAGGGAYFDAMNMHPYDYTPNLATDDQQYPTTAADCPGNEWNPWVDCPYDNGANNNNQQQEISSVRTEMNQNGDSAKAIWLTEFGCPTGTDGGYSAVCTDATLAQEITDAFQQVQANPGDEYGLLGPLFVYDLIDTNSSDDASGSGYDDFGLYTDTCAAKPGALSAFESGAQAGGGSSTTTCSKGRDLHRRRKGHRHAHRRSAGAFSARVTSGPFAREASGQRGPSTITAVSSVRT